VKKKMEWITPTDMTPKQVHVMPNDGSHNTSKYCWCSPQLSYRDAETKGEVWTHRRKDN